VGGLGRDRGQSDQYQSVPGSNGQRIESGAAIGDHQEGEEKRWRKNDSPERTHELGSEHRSRPVLIFAPESS
jgi:hypothetical protein